jgi:hypothetical protein
VTLVLFGLAYRLRLGLTLGDTFASDVPSPLLALLRQGAVDVMFALLIAGLTLLVSQLGLLLSELRPGQRERPARHLFLRRLGVFLLGLLLLEIGLVCQAHHGVFFATGNGLTTQLLEESLSFAALKELLFLLTPGEVAFILLPLFLFIGLSLLRNTLVRRWLDRGTVGLAFALVAFACIVPSAPLPEALLHHPAGFLAIDFARSQKRLKFLAGDWLKDAGAEPVLAGDALPVMPPDDADSAALPAGELPETPTAAGAKNPPTMALLSSQFVYSPSERPIKKTLPATGTKTADGQPYNVLFVLMESTGLQYALAPISGTGGARPDDGATAMPFLHSLSQKGYLLSDHYSSGNSSPRGIFSLFSGLYVMPEVSIFDVRKDVYLPSLASYLGDHYQRFLVTPASLDWYFPHAFFLHSGLSELWGYHALPVHKNAPGGRSHARDEAETVSFFLRRLDEHVSSGAPFLGIYYSFLAHWPYPDYGAETHVINPTRPLHAYYNALHFLDTQIERIFQHLEERHLLDRTIVVLVGDHGEAFGQHANNYTHSRMSFNENLRTPAIIYQPRLFPPRVVTAPTSHVDILPTLLDALGVSYDPNLLQGESLFQDQFRRRYIFIYGNEDTLTSVSAEKIKLQLSLRDGSCWVYDLRSDPEERRRLSCQAHRDQQQALLLYRNHQRTALRRYNQVAAHLPGQIVGQVEPAPAKGDCSLDAHSPACSTATP